MTRSMLNHVIIKKGVGEIFSFLLMCSRGLKKDEKKETKRTERKEN